MNPSDCKTCRHRACYCQGGYCLGYEADDEAIKASVLDQALDKMIDEHTEEDLHPEEANNG